MQFGPIYSVLFGLHPPKGEAHFPYSRFGHFCGSLHNNHYPWRGGRRIRSYGQASICTSGFVRAAIFASLWYDCCTYDKKESSYGPNMLLKPHTRYRFGHRNRKLLKCRLLFRTHAFWPVLVSDHNGWSINYFRAYHQVPGFPLLGGVQAPKAVFLAKCLEFCD